MSDLHYFDPSWIQPSDKRVDVDICVYGGTASGVIAAVEARRLNKTVILLQPGKFIGGLTTGGLGWTDYGQKKVIGGLSREFYRRVGKHYGLEEEFHFEPHVASAVLDGFVAEHDVPVRLCQYIDTFERVGQRIVSIKLLGGLRVSAKMFIDATYEGDLLAKAGVTFTLGREDNSQYGEKLNGIQVHRTHQFTDGVDPFVKEGKADSGLLPGIESNDLSTKQGTGDRRIQAYNFRVCMTDDPALRIDWQKPDNFDPRLYVLAGRWLNSKKDNFNELVHEGNTATPSKFDNFPHKTPGGYHKTDTNNHGAVSSDFIGANYDWPEGCYERREALFQAHVAYQQGFYWYVANADEVPDKYRAAFRRWGLPRDEFATTGNWPCQLYVREARRLVSDYVITEHDCRGERRANDSVGIGSYGMDSHNCARFVKMDGGKPRVLNEGDVQVPAVAYPVSYRAIIPRRGECENLLAPVCVSATHIAYGSVRMEPVFMALGQSAAAAASLAIDRGCGTQELPYDVLRKRLAEGGQLVEPA